MRFVLYVPALRMHRYVILYMCMYAYKRGGGMDRCTDGWMYRWVDGWMDGGTGEWIDVQSGRWMDGEWMDDGWVASG